MGMSALSASPVGTSEPSSFSRPPLLAAARGRPSPRPPSAPRTGYAQARRAADSRAGTGPIRVSNANPFTVNGRLAGQTTEKLLVKRGKPKRRVKLPSRPLRVAARAQDGEAEAPACGSPPARSLRPDLAAHDGPRPGRRRNRRTVEGPSGPRRKRR